MSKLRDGARNSSFYSPSRCQPDNEPEKPTDAIRCDERQLLLPVNDNYNSRFITSLENSILKVLERQRKQKEPVGRLALPLPRKHFMYAIA